MPGTELHPRKPVAIVVGALAPYTHVLYELLANRLDRPLHVLACSARETARLWQLEEERSYRFEVLKGLRWHRSSVVNHYVNPSVASRLAALRPAAVVLNDFAPTMMIAAAAARLLRIPYGLRTDGIPQIDPGRASFPHRLIRRAIVPGAKFGIGPSQGSKALLEAYGLKSPFALSPLFPAWQATTDAPLLERPFDVMFCGALNEELKGARFFTDVVLGCAAQGRSLNVRVVGAGPLREEMQFRFAEAGVFARFDGFLQQAELAEAYGSARVFMFPSRGDVWGIVVQEALQSGMLVISSPFSGVARELIEPGKCGAVLPLQRDAWIERTLALLTDSSLHAPLRDAGRTALAAFTVERAATAYLKMLEPLLEEGPTCFGPAPQGGTDAA